jgi:hypothetical protein
MLDLMDTKKEENKWKECRCRGKREPIKIGMFFYFLSTVPEHVISIRSVIYINLLIYGTPHGNINIEFYEFVCLGRRQGCPNL